MAESNYYVYALKDPRSPRAVPFYVGKGTGTRAHDHLVKPDASRRGDRIRDIEATGRRVLVSILIDEISEVDAIKLEAELISAFGTVDTGGILLNSVIPKGVVRKPRAGVTVPHGALEKAQLGVSLLKDAVLEFAKANARGITNSDAARYLGLRSDYGGGSKDYLSYSVLGLLMREGRLKRDSRSKRHIAQVE